MREEMCPSETASPVSSGLGSRKSHLDDCSSIIYHEVIHDLISHFHSKSTPHVTPRSQELAHCTYIIEYSCIFLLFATCMYVTPARVEIPLIYASTFSDFFHSRMSFISFITRWLTHCTLIMSRNMFPNLPPDNTYNWPRLWCRS